LKKILFSLMILTLISGQALAKPTIKEPVGFGINLGAGLQMGTGFAGSGGMTYIIANEDNMGFEVGGNLLMTFGTSNTIDPNTNFRYTDDAVILYYSALVDVLFNYRPGKACVYQFIGAGIGASTKTDTKTSADDPASNDTITTSSGAIILNFGVAGAFGSGFELRLQVPVYIRLEDSGTAVAPAVTLGFGYRI
jgi:hypothetical protein